MAIKAVNGDFMCSVQRLRQILVFGAKNSSGCGLVQKKPQQVVLCAKTSSLRFGRIGRNGKHELLHASNVAITIN
jgi:hypothetical protein